MARILKFAFLEYGNVNASVNVFTNTNNNKKQQESYKNIF
jgi:flagellar biosynthesis/type III secretory pathway M-ring protein FliF/YscJ